MMAYPISLFIVGKQGSLITHKTGYATDLKHAESICDECQQQDKEERDYLVSVLNPNTLKVIHVYTTKDHQKGGRDDR
jgi:hypothetical protein